jgi:hypothetical protein
MRIMKKRRFVTADTKDGGHDVRSNYFQGETYEFFNPHKGDLSFVTLFDLTFPRFPDTFEIFHPALAAMKVDA